MASRGLGENEHDHVEWGADGGQQQHGGHGGGHLAHGGHGGGGHHAGQHSHSHHGLGAWPGDPFATGGGQDQHGVGVGVEGVGVGVGVGLAGEGDDGLGMGVGADTDPYAYAQYAANYGGQFYSAADAAAAGYGNWAGTGAGVVGNNGMVGVSGLGVNSVGGVNVNVGLGAPGGDWANQYYATTASYPQFPQQTDAGDPTSPDPLAGAMPMAGTPSTSAAQPKRSRKKGEGNAGAASGRGGGGGGTSTNGRRATACRLCKKRKRSCDGTRPQCGRCVGIGIACSWPDDGDEEAEIPVRKVACVECHRNKKTCVGAIPSDDGSEEAATRCERCMSRDIPCIIPVDGGRKKQRGGSAGGGGPGDEDGHDDSGGGPGSGPGPTRKRRAPKGGNNGTDDSGAATKPKRRRRGDPQPDAGTGAQDSIEGDFGQHQHHQNDGYQEHDHEHEQHSGYWNNGQEQQEFYGTDGTTNGHAANGSGSLDQIDSVQLREALVGAGMLTHEEPTVVGMTFIPPLSFVGMASAFGNRDQLQHQHQLPPPPFYEPLQLQQPQHPLQPLQLSKPYPSPPHSSDTSPTVGRGAGNSGTGLKTSLSRGSPDSALSASISPTGANYEPLQLPPSMSFGNLGSSPLSASCSNAHLEHFLRYNYPIINLTHPTYLQERISKGTCEPALYWSVLALASLACSHCADCRDINVKRSLVQRAGIELVIAVRSALSRPWNGPVEWYSRVQVAAALFLQLGAAFSVKNHTSIERLKVPLEVLLKDQTGLGIRANEPRQWVIDGGRRWIEWDEGLRVFWLPRNLALFGRDLEPSKVSQPLSINTLLPAGADIPAKDVVFESIHPEARAVTCPAHHRVADLFTWIATSPASDPSVLALARTAVPSTLEAGSIANNSLVASMMAMLVEFRRFSLRNNITWTMLRNRRKMGAPYGADPVGLATTELERINWMLDTYLSVMPESVQSCIIEGDAPALCAIFGSSWGPPNREKFASQMLIYLSFQCVAKSHMSVGREAGIAEAMGQQGMGAKSRNQTGDSSEDEESQIRSTRRKFEEEQDECAFVESQEFLEATRYAIMGTQLVRSLLKVNSKPMFLSQFTAVAMLRLGYVHLLAFKTLSEAAKTGSAGAGDRAAREAVLSNELLGVCTYVMNLALKFVSFNVHGMQLSKDLLDEVEKVTETVRDVVGSAGSL